MDAIIGLEQQIFKLEEILLKTPEILGVSNGRKVYNSTYFSLTNKIKQLKNKLNELRKPSHAKAWMEHLAK